LAAGVEIVWVADPQRKVVSVLRRDAEPAEFNIGDVLMPGPVLAEFRLPLVELFAE
jgi:hypothetical protein